MERGVYRTLLAAGALAFAGLGAQAADLPAKTVPMTMPAEAAAPTSPIDFTVGVKWMSDYNFRGISQSKRDPSAMAYGEIQLYDFFYAGITAYRVDLPTKPGAEVDLTAGIRPKFGPFTFDLGITYYYYPGERALIGPDGTVFSVRNTDFLEYGGKVTYAATDDLALTAGAYHTGSWLGSHADATYTFGQAKYTIPKGFMGFMPEGFALSGEFGHYFLGTFNSGFVGVPVKLPSYNYANIGMSYTWEVFTLDVRYHATDLGKKSCQTLTGDPRGIVTGSGRSNWCGNALIASLSMDLQGSKLPGIFAPK